MNIRRDEISGYEQRVKSSALRAATAIKQSLLEDIDWLRWLKFEQAGAHPLEDRSLNFIEQLNQSFTYMVSLRAAEKLFELHPDLEVLRLNLGTRGGSDIECPNLTCAAEVFAAVDPQNNRKLAKDIAKVAKRIDVENRYVFFHSPGYAERPHHNLGQKFDVKVWSLAI
jgi:hypothetical protein